MTLERLSWASGDDIREGWHHSDAEWYPGMRTDETYPVVHDHLGPIQRGLPWSDGTMDYVVSHHGLMMLPEPDLVPALVELRRVTKPGGWLRVSVPDLEGAVSARWRNHRSWFPVEAGSIDEAFCIYVTQGGATRSVFTRDRLYVLLRAAGWEGLRAAHPFESAGPKGITDLDSRPHESIYMDAMKP